MGISSDVWSAYMRDRLELQSYTAEQIRDRVTRQDDRALPRARPAPAGRPRRRGGAASRWPLAVASGSDRVLLDTVLASHRAGTCFAATVAGDEVAVGKPHPVSTGEACRRLGPTRGGAWRSRTRKRASPPGWRPGRRSSPSPGPASAEPEILARATVVLPDLTELDADRMAAVMAQRSPGLRPPDGLDQVGQVHPQDREREVRVDGVRVSPRVCTRVGAVGASMVRTAGRPASMNGTWSLLNGLRTVCTVSPV